MPYDNPLNRKIADRVRQINEKYIQHTLNSYDLKVADYTVGTARKNLVNESNINREKADLLDKEDDLYSDSGSETDKELEPNQYESNELEGGAYGSKGGFAKGTWRDTGFDNTMGAGKTHPQYHNNENKFEGGNFFSDFGKGFKKGFSSIVKPASAILGLLPIPQAQVASKVLGTASDIIGSAKKIRKPRKELLLKRVMDGGEKPNKTYIGLMSGGKRRGRPSKMKLQGGAENLARPFNMIDKAGITGSGKKRIVGGKHLVPVAQMPSSGMSGQGKLKSRSDLVKKIMNDRKVSMCQASKIVKDEKLWTK